MLEISKFLYIYNLDMYIYISVEFWKGKCALKIYIRLYVLELSPYVIMKS